MILIVGASGTLGGHVARQLLAKGHAVRAMTRDPARVGSLAELGADVVRGDLRDAASLQAATRGVRTVVSASHSILGAGKSSSARVDDEGQRALIAAAKAADVGHFVYTSALGASDNHPVDFWRTKAKLERCVQDSRVAYTIVRPSAFIDFHAYQLIGKAVVSGKRVVLFGPGTNPRNFVAAEDVATLVVLALEDEQLRGETIEIGGPENLTDLQVVAVFEKTSGRTAKVTHVPLAVPRMLAGVLRPVHSGMSRIMLAAVVAETSDQTFDRAPFPTTRLIGERTLEEWARRNV